MLVNSEPSPTNLGAVILLTLVIVADDSILAAVAALIALSAVVAIVAVVA